MISILGWFGGFWPRVALVVGAIAVLVGWRAYDVAKHEARGAEKARTKIEKANTDAAKLGTRAADKSRAGGVQSGQRDPLTRD